MSNQSARATDANMEKQPMIDAANPYREFPEPKPAAPAAPCEPSYRDKPVPLPRQ